MRSNVVLWVVQALLAALFLFAGVMKLVLPIEAMAGPVALPGPFLRFIGIAEAAGALGLVLPGLFRICTYLTSLAAGGLIVIMAGAVVVTLLGGALAPAMFPLVIGLLLAVVAYGRRQPARSARGARGSVLQPAA